MNARFMKIAAQDYCKFDVAECYALDHFQNSGLVAPFRRKHGSVMRLACLINDCGVGQHFHSCFEFLRNEEHTSQNADPIVVYSCGAIGVKVIRPRFAYISPFLKQSKAVAWDYLRAAMSPLRSIGATVNESELRVDYPNGGQVRLYGADNAEALRGQYFDGIVLDEFADMDARVWSEIVRPALSDRSGWAVFIGTPKGHNEFYKLYERSQSDPDWFSLMLKASETGFISTVFSAEILDRHLGSGHRANAGNIRVDARHVLEHANLHHALKDLFLSLCGECAR